MHEATNKTHWHEPTGGKKAGFDFHLTKPVDFHELRTVLGEIAA